MWYWWLNQGPGHLLVAQLNDSSWHHLCSYVGGSGFMVAMCQAAGRESPVGKSGGTRSRAEDWGSDQSSHAAFQTCQYRLLAQLLRDFTLGWFALAPPSQYFFCESRNIWSSPHIRIQWRCPPLLRERSGLCSALYPRRGCGCNCLSFPRISWLHRAVRNSVRTFRGHLPIHSLLKSYSDCL